MKGTLIVFGVERSKKGMSAASYSKFYRKFYGYNNSSFYGRYRSRIPGFLERMKHIRYAKGVIMVDDKNGKRVIRFLRSNKARVFSWTVDLSKKEQELFSESEFKKSD